MTLLVDAEDDFASDSAFDIAARPGDVLRGGTKYGGKNGSCVWMSLIEEGAVAWSLCGGFLGFFAFEVDDLEEAMDAGVLVPSLLISTGTALVPPLA